MLKISIGCCILFLIGLCSSEIRYRSPYLSLSSEEFDSTEHGGPRGPKGTTCKCGWRNKEHKRIIGGKETEANEYPLIAALIDKRMKYTVCGCSLLTARHALTAAHCTRTHIEEGLPMSVVIGEYDNTKDSSIEREIDIKKIIEHPKYNRTADNMVNDIAVLVLKQKIKFNKFVGPACLPRSRVDLDNKYVRTLGWGITREKGPGSEVLKQVDERVVPLELCAKYFPGKFVPAQQLQLCTYGRNRTACRGDSGGPVLWVDPETNRYTLIGVVSYGDGCLSGKPSVNTDIYSYMAWIEETIQRTIPGVQTCKKIA